MSRSRSRLIRTLQSRLSFYRIHKAPRQHTRPLPAGRRSGLVEAQRVVADVEGIEFVYFTEKDVVRHHLVHMIVQAYEKHSKTKLEDKL